jgi:hypothetical protein
MQRWSSHGSQLLARPLWGLHDSELVVVDCPAGAGTTVGHHSRSSVPKGAWLVKIAHTTKARGRAYFIGA